MTGRTTFGAAEIAFAKASKMMKNDMLLYLDLEDACCAQPNRYERKLSHEGAKRAKLRRMPRVKRKDNPWLDKDSRAFQKCVSRSRMEGWEYY